MTHRTTHLTETEFSDAVIGIASVKVLSHLETCESCSDEARQVEASISSFSAAATTWSRAQSVPAASRFRTQAFWYSLRPLMGFVAAAALVVSVAIPVGRHQGAESASPEATQMSAVAEAEIAPTFDRADVRRTDSGRRVGDDLDHDNDLMSAVNEAISTPMYVAISTEPDGLAAGTTLGDGAAVNRSQ